MTELNGGWGYSKMAYWDEQPLFGRLNFGGTYDPNKEYQYLDCCVRNDEVYIYDGSNNWTSIGASGEFQQEKTEEEIFFHCTSCGAPTRYDGVCPYCGTINRKVKKINVR